MIFCVPYYQLICRWEALNFGGACTSVLYKAVFLYLKALSHDLRAGLLVALREHQGSWDLTSAPWFLNLHRKFCLDFTAELGDSNAGNSDDISYWEVGMMAMSTLQPHGPAPPHVPGQATATSTVWVPLPLPDGASAPAAPCTSHGLSLRPWHLTRFNIH